MMSGREYNFEDQDDVVYTDVESLCLRHIPTHMLQSYCPLFEA